MSTPNMSNIYCRATRMAGSGPDSDHKSILSKPLLQEKKYFREPLHVDAGPRNRIDVSPANSNKPS